jgi:probable DNA metabolism protein
MMVFLCQDSPDGILTGVYDAWASRLGHGNVRLETDQRIHYELFTEYSSVVPDMLKAKKVAETIQRRLGEETWKMIYQAALSDREEKADAIYRTIVFGLSCGGFGGRLMENLKEPILFQVFQCSRSVEREAHRYLGFLRFREMEGGFLYGEIEPNCQVLPLIGDHFANRFPGENFLIRDKKREQFLIHRKNQPWMMAEGEEFHDEFLKESEKEAKYEELWQRFVTVIAIRERENPGLQNRLLPLKFRKYMTEKF